jgi:hypothetical protein
VSAAGGLLVRVGGAPEPAAALARRVVEELVARGHWAEAADPAAAAELAACGAVAVVAGPLPEAVRERLDRAGAGLVELDASTEAAADQVLAALAAAGEGDDDVYSEQEEGEVAERLASLGYLE